MEKKIDSTVVKTVKENKVMKNIIEWIHKQLLFVITVTFIFGACAGLYGGKMIYENKLSEAVKIGGAVLENKVYDVKIRP